MSLALKYLTLAKHQADSPGSLRRRGGFEPSLAPLEGRRLLSFLNPFGNKFASVRSGGVVDVITVSGPGQVFTKRINRQAIAISLAGTTQDSQVAISSLGAHAGTLNSPLQIGNIRVKTGRLGSFNGATTADLNGPLSPLIGPVNSLQFDAVGPRSQINVKGNLGALTVNRGIDLAPTGSINVSNDLTGSFSVARDVTLDGGQVNIGRDLAGTVSVGGNLTVDNGGRFAVNRNLGGSAAGSSVGGSTVTGNLTLHSNGKLAIGGNVTSLTVVGNVEASGGGGIAVVGNLGSLTVSGGGGAAITGNLTLGSGGELLVGQNLGSLSVGSNVDTSKGGEIQVNGNLGITSVTGMVQGKGSEDLVIGANLGQLTVLGGGVSSRGLQGVNIDVGKSIQGLDIRNGISDSLITAGILIDGGTPGAGSNGWNVGPVGTLAVFDSEVRAGYEIRNIMIGGDVQSDLPTNPAGRVTRIVAGEDRGGNFSAGGIIDNFQIVGRLIDAVLAASVQPYGGTGAEPPTPTPPDYMPPTSMSNDNGYKTYDKPVGPKYTAPPYAPSSDLTIDDLVLPGGAINPSFSASHKLTVLGGVISTSHGDNADFAGFFAANTNGVSVGP